jgi:hypothetical protein
MHRVTVYPTAASAAQSRSVVSSRVPTDDTQLAIECMPHDAAAARPHAHALSTRLHHQHVIKDMALLRRSRTSSGSASPAFAFPPATETITVLSYFPPCADGEWHGISETRSDHSPALYHLNLCLRLQISAAGSPILCCSCLERRIPCLSSRHVQAAWG